MTDQVNSNYLENYASRYTSEVCSNFFKSKNFIGGQDILNLTNSIQVNYFVFKRLFGLWQEELGKLKSNPFFDYRDIAVHEALSEFMNVLSKRIKVEKGDFEPLLKMAVIQAVEVATDPVSYFKKEVKMAPDGHVNEYLKENQKYYKWHVPVISFLIDKAGFGLEKEPYLKAISANYQVIQGDLESQNLLLATLGDIAPFDLDAYLGTENEASTIAETGEDADKSFFDNLPDQEEVKEETQVNDNPEPEPEPKNEEPISKPTVTGGKLNAAQLKREFETESYTGMKAVVANLSDGIAINQRFMFTKELFEGNADLLMHALKQVDGTASFEEAVELINKRYVGELDWEVGSEPVTEFLQLVYRRFDG